MSITALRTVVASAETPITVSDAKSHLRITYAAEDSYIQSLIQAATDWAQVYTGRIFCDTQVLVRIDCFPDVSDSPELVGDLEGRFFYVRHADTRKKEANKRSCSILLPGGFVTAVNNINYTDDAGAPQTLTGPTSGTPGTDYQEDLTDDEWAFVYPSATAGWPAVDSSVVNAVSIDYQVGWASAFLIPASIKQAIRFKVADLFSIRDTNDSGNRSQLLMVAENLLDPYVVPSF